MNYLDRLAKIARAAIKAKAGEVCGEIVWIHNDDLDKDIPAICLVAHGIEHLH